MDKCLYAQGTAQHRRIDTDLLNQMDPAASAKGSSVMNKVWRLCNGWLMDAKCANGSTTILYVGPKNADDCGRRLSPVMTCDQAGAQPA